MRELHLFAGAGGGILGGMLLGHTCVCAVEWNDYCQEVLRARQRDGQLPEFPIFGDIREFDGKPWRGRVDVVCGGTPCQPWSSAGKRLRERDERHLWSEMARVVAECRPPFVFLENVDIRAFREPHRDLRRMGYRVPHALELSAGDVGAPFRRTRWWLIAADTYRDRKPVQSVYAEVGWASPSAARGWHPWRNRASRLRRLVSRDAPRMDATERIRAAGNAQVPAVAAAAFRILMARARNLPAAT